jgi:hypothetical protein
MWKVECDSGLTGGNFRIFQKDFLDGLVMVEEISADFA